MANTLSSTLVPPSRKTVNFLYNGLVIFYPESVFGAKEGKKRAALNYWPEAGYRRPDFARLLWNITKTEDTESAAKIVLDWKNTLERGIPLKETIPANLDEMLSRLEESSTEKKLSPYKAQQLAKESLLVSQKSIEESASVVTPQEEVGVPAPKIISKAASPLNVFAGKITTAPFRSAVYLSGPTVHSSKAEGEGSGIATARHMLTHGITSSSILSLKRRAQEIGITPNQLENLAKLIKQEQEAHPLNHRWITIIYSSQKARLTQAQVASLLIPSADGTTAVFPRKSFLGGLLGRIGQQLLGKLASKGIKTVAKKAAAKLATTAAAQVAATAIAPGVANVIVLVGQAILGKIKDFISSLKSKEGKEKILAFIFGSMVLGGILLGGPVGAVLVMGGLVPGLGFLVTKAGGFGPLGASVGSYGQAFLAGLTGVILPAIGAPIIIAFISIPILIAIILFIINSGAYIVPPRSAQFGGVTESPYIDVEKKAAPDCLNKSGCPNLPGTITYKVTIAAKKGTLTNISFDNSYFILGEGSPSDLPKPPTHKAPEVISPVEPYSFTYSLTLGEKLNDSIVYDVFAITADAPEQKAAMASDVASVIIGNPPAGSCPILGGHITYPSYDGTKDNQHFHGGHGSNAYWGSYNCNYDIPYSSGCWSPSGVVDPDKDNKCRGKPKACNHYGFAVDVQRNGAGDPVQLPAILGNSITWKKQRQFSNNGGAWGYGVTYTGADDKGNNYFIYFTHLNHKNFPSEAVSGSVIGTLSPNLSNPHVHIEFSINGQWARPDFLCGGKGP